MAAETRMLLAIVPWAHAPMATLLRIPTDGQLDQPVIARAVQVRDGMVSRTNRVIDGDFPLRHIRRSGPHDITPDVAYCRPEETNTRLPEMGKLLSNAKRPAHAGLRITLRNGPMTLRAIRLRSHHSSQSQNNQNHNLSVSACICGLELNSEREKNLRRSAFSGIP